MQRDKLWKSSVRSINVNIQLFCASAKLWKLFWDIPFTVLLVNCEKTSVYSVWQTVQWDSSHPALSSTRPFMALHEGCIKKSFVAKQQVLRGKKCQFSFVGTRFSPFLQVMMCFIYVVPSEHNLAVVHKA